MKSQKAFTLIELLIVVAIIAILAAIAVPNFLEAQTRAKVSRVQADLRSIATAIEAYRVDNTRYPSIQAPNAGAGQLNGFSVYNPTVRGVSSRLTALTTPISFITSVPRDAFIPTNADFAYAPSATSRNPLDGYDTYDYVDAQSFTANRTISINLSTTQGAARSSGAAWHIVSCGPDQRAAFGGGFIGIGPVTNQLGVDYDPTNGTVSAGDIVRVGGGPGPLPSSTLPAIDRIQNKINF